MGPRFGRLLCLVALACLRAWGEGSAPGLAGYIAPEQEAPTSLLSFTVGDASVVLDAKGSWKAGVEAGVGLRVVPGQGILFPASVASLPAGVAFSQEPTVSFGVRIDDRYYIEAGISSPSAAGSSALLPAGIGYLALGYTAPGDGILRSVTIGTRGVEMGSYPFLSVPAMGANSAGAGAVLDTGGARQEILVRVDKLPGDSVTFIGMNRVVETRISPDRYLRGRQFLLPDRGATEAEVLLEDPGGAATGDDGRRYRSLRVDDGRVSGSDGTVTLHATPSGRLLVWYRDGSGREVGDTALGRGVLPAPRGDGIDQDAPGVDFDWSATYLGRPLAERRVVVAGRGYLRLWEPGEFSPFEVPSSYALESPSDAASTVVVDTVVHSSGVACGDAPAGLAYTQLPDEGRFVATLGADPRESMRERFPFPDAAGRLYGPLPAVPVGYATCEIRVRVLTPVAHYQIPPPVLAGSVRVVRNGLEESRFTIDYGSGRVDLDTPPAAGDVVVVSYRSAGSGAAPSEVVAGWGNRISLGEHAALEIAGGLLWNAQGGGFTDAPDQSRGGVVASVGVSGSAGTAVPPDGPPPPVRATVTYDASAGVSVFQPDTTGVRRLFGMEGSGRTLDLSAETAWPSAAPDPGEGVPSAVSASTRGKLVYRDYRQYDAAGGASLLSYDTPSWPPADQVHQYTDGEITGAYQVGGSSAGSTGTSLALEFTMGDTQWWAGMQMPVSSSPGLDDLSWVQAIAVSLAAAATEGSYDVYVQIGAISEDLDGNGILDRESSASSAGFAFHDAANAVTLRVGAGPRGLGNGRQDSEDIDGNGFLDPEEPAYLLTVGPTEGGETLHSQAGVTWVTASSVLGPADARRLTRSRAVRVLVVKTAGGPCSGRLLVDRIELSGSGFWAHPAGAGTVSARETREADLDVSLRAPAPLEQVYPEVSTRFHADGGEQEVMELSWQGLDPASLVARGYPRRGSGGTPYRVLELYLRVPELTVAAGATAATLSLALLDGAGKGIRLGMPLERFDDWRALVVDLDRGSATLGGTAVSGASVTDDADDADLVTLTVAVDGAASGRAYLDEIALASPRLGAGVAAGAGAEVRLEGSLVTVAGVTLVSGVRVRERLAAMSSGFSPLFGSPARGASFRSSTDMAVDLAFGRVEAFAVVEASPAGVGTSGGHRIAISRLLPGRWPVGLGVTDAFTASAGEPAAGTPAAATHTLELAATVAQLVTAGAGVDLRSDSGALEQVWRGSLSVGASPAARIGIDARLSKAARGYALPGAWYGAWWADGFGSLLPFVGGTDTYRKGRADIVASATAGAVGVAVDGSLWFSTTGIDGGRRRQETGAVYEVRLPISVRPSGGAELAVAPAYRQELVLMTRPVEGRQDFVDDFEELGSVLARGSWMLGFAPLANVASPAALAEVVSRLRGVQEVPFAGARWTPSVALELSRGAGSRLVDLVIPVYLEVSFGRQARLDGDVAEAATVFSAATRLTALNLFGRSGAYRIFAFYDDDELSATVRAAMALPLDAESPPATVDVAVTQLASLSAGVHTTFEIENKLQIRQADAFSVSDSGEARFSWRQLDGIRVPTFLVGATDKAAVAGRAAPGTLRHLEKVSVQVTGPMSAASRSVAVVVRHETVLDFPSVGTATARVGVGADFTDQDGVWVPGLGVEAGVEVELRF